MSRALRGPVAGVHSGPGHDRARRSVAASDVVMSLSLLGLWPLAWCLPSGAWSPVSNSITRAKAAFLRSRFPAPAPAVEAAFPQQPAEFVQRIGRELDANRRELRMQILRKNAPWGWTPDIQLEGTRYLQDALQAHCGVVLWVSHFVFCGLIAKIALHDAGYAVTHLSRPEHGFSKTKFGIRVLNPLRCSVEDRNLAGRIVIDRSNMHATMRRVQQALEGNGIVSITAGAWEARQIVSAPMFAGRLSLATGAPALAWSCGAALIPVHGVRQGGRRFRVVVDKPLSVDRSLAKHAFADAAVSAYVESLQPFVARYPGQWRGWGSL
jgi:lauroyl/myristoyl acyltransferase